MVTLADRLNALSRVAVFVAAVVCIGAGLTSRVCGQQPGQRAPLVLLTFDTEMDEDVRAIRDLGVDVPVTYFITGEFAQRNGRLVRQLAERNAIGSHGYSHGNLKEMDRDQMRKELTLQKVVLEREVGRPIRWFRAPYLEYDEEVMRTLEELGFEYDSSDTERWIRNTILTELPITQTLSGMMSDYDIFVERSLSGDAALSYLKEAYDQRAAAGRAFVVLLHPRIIAAHRQVLHGLIEHIRATGAEFMSVDQYVAATRSATPRRTGVWIDLSLGAHDPAQTAADLRAARMDEAFLSANDPSGIDYYGSVTSKAGGEQDAFGRMQKSLKAAGLKVHAWISVNKNLRLAKLRPDLAMHKQNGTASTAWISPSQAEVRQHVLRTVAAILENYEIDGIHLDYIRYPSLNYDFSPAAIERYKAEVGLASVSAGDLLSGRHYTSWVDWRSREIASLVAEVRRLVKDKRGEAVVVSAALVADAALSYRAMERYGQAYPLLAGSLDLILPMAYFQLERKPVEWIADVNFITRYWTGSGKTVLTGLQGYQKPGAFTLDPVTFHRMLEVAAPGTDGLVFYPYLHLFGRGEPSQNLEIDAARTIAAIKTASPAVATVAPVQQPVPARPDANPSAPGPSERSSTGGIGPWWLIAWVVAATGISAGAVLWLLWSRRERQPGLRSSRGGGDAVETDANGPLADWRQLNQSIQGGSVSGQVCVQVSRILRNHGPRGIDKNRLLYTLFLVKRSDGALASFLDAVRSVPGWQQLGLRNLQEATMLRLVLQEGISFGMTPAGEEELQRAIDAGFDPEFWEFVEGRMHETLAVDCPHCGTSNLSNWYWDSFECRGCGATVALHRVERIKCGILDVPADGAILVH